MAEKPKRNRVISRKKIRDFCENHPGEVAAPIALGAWFKDVAGACWMKWAAVREMHPTADLVDGLIVFNVGGNKYRVICEVHYDVPRVLIRHVLTHAEYDKGKWKS